MSKINYGIQMFCLRDITPKDMKKALTEVADMGYKYVEFGGLYDYSPSQIKGWLDDLGLICTGAHIGLDELSPEKINDTIKVYKEVGCNHFIVPWCDANKADEIIDKLNYAYKVLKKEDIELSYHNHSFEFFPASEGGVIMEDEIIKRTSLGLQIDTFWLYNAGIDVIEYLNTHKDRITFIHLKDGIPAPKENRCFERNTQGVKGLSTGEGKVPIKDIRNWAIENNVAMIVESEGMQPSGIEEVERCIRYLKSLE